MIFIPGNVPSLKNSKKICRIGRGASARSILVHSDAVKKYLQKIGVKSYKPTGGVVEYKTRVNVFRERIGDYFEDTPIPCVLGLHFIRSSKRKFDINNAMAIIHDLVVAHGFLPDDDASHMIPVPIRIDGDWFSVCKSKPGVIMTIIDGELKDLSYKLRPKQ